MRKMNQASLDNYFDKVIPELNARQTEIYRIIKKYPDITTSQIAKVMGLKAAETHKISGRITELKRAKFIYSSRVAQDPILKTSVNFWRAAAWNE
jgi:predicted HTH transcriptional regulator